MNILGPLYQDPYSHLASLPTLGPKQIVTQYAFPGGVGTLNLEKPFTCTQISCCDFFCGPGIRFESCSQIAQDGDGNIAVFDRRKKKIEIVDHSGTLVRAIKNLTLTQDFGDFAIGPDNHFYVADGGTIRIYAPPYRLLRAIPHDAHLVKEWHTDANLISGIAITPDGHVLIYDSYLDAYFKKRQLQYLNPSGNCLAKGNLDGVVDCYPGQIAWNPATNSFAVSGICMEHKGLYRPNIAAKSIDFVRDLTEIDGKGSISSICFDANGSLVVGHIGHGAEYIEVFSPDGTRKQTLKEDATLSLTIDTHGRIIVFNNNRDLKVWSNKSQKTKEHIEKFKDRLM